MKRRYALAAVLLIAALPLRAAGPSLDELKQTLQQRFPTIHIDAVQAAPIPGVYEVIAGDQIVYSDATGNYVLVGRLMDTRTRHDLSAEQLDAYYSIDYRKLPFDRAIKIVKGTGARQFALFADPDCPYCRALEQSLRSVTNVTIYVFLLPLDHVHPHASEHARAIWCSPDRASAWTNWLLNRTPPPGTAACTGDPIGEIHKLAVSLHVDGTPTMFLVSGRRIGGALPAVELEKLLAQATTQNPSGAATTMSALPRQPSGG